VCCKCCVLRVLCVVSVVSVVLCVECCVLYVVSVVCCEVEVSMTGRSLVQRSPIECVSAIRCDRNCLHLQWADRGRSESVRKKETEMPSHLCFQIRISQSFRSQRDRPSVTPIQVNVKRHGFSSFYVHCASLPTG